MRAKKIEQNILNEEAARKTSTRKFHVRLIIDLSRPAGRGILQGVSEYVKELDNWRFETSFSFFGEKCVHDTSINKHKTDGIIFFSSDYNMLDKVIRSDVPAIVQGFSHRVPNFINFCGDEMMLCKIAFDHFRYLGFKKFAYCGFSHLNWSIERGEVFREIVKENGCEINVYPKRSTQRSKKWEKEKPILTKWLNSLPNPVGLLTANDVRGKEVLEACLDAQIKVPDQIAVLGPDNDECICPFTNPPLSSIARNSRKGGYEAAKTLTKLMSGEMPENNEIAIEPKGVIQRQSTNIMSVNNKTVSEALFFIRSNKKRPLSTAQVAEHVAVHSRVLFSLFKKYLGHTVYDEIKRVRADEIARLLVETDKTVSQIAHEMGFNNTDNFSRYFYQAKQTSPTDYRRRFLLLK